MKKRNSDVSDTIPSLERISDPGFSVVISKDLYETLLKFVLILPVCEINGCKKISTKKVLFDGYVTESYTCDDHENQYDNNGSRETNWAEATRRLEKALKHSGFETIEDALFTKGIKF